MKTQHTSAPWDIFPKNDTLEIGNYGANAPLVRLSATVPTNDWEGWANARLISASPDLLSALEKLLSRSLTLDQSATHDGLQNCEAIAQAREAIRKARGEA